MEFLLAVGEYKLYEMIQNTDKAKPYNELLHKKLIELLRSYYLVGGMPEAVKYFAETKDYKEVREIQKEIINSYKLDFAKHAHVTDIPKLSLIWDSIPVHLSKKNKKFIFSAVKTGARSREYENALQWLEDSGLMIKSYLIKKGKHPLKSYSDRNIFKVFCLDVGILGALANVPIDILVKGNKLFNEYEGAFVENYVAQQLVAEKNYDLYYWTSCGKAEVDFIIEDAGEIYPLEAKAGINLKSKSLKVYSEKYSPKKIFKTSLSDLSESGKHLNIPLYAISKFSL
jgi:predicted AAA+ superfamily ATPase